MITLSLWIIIFIVSMYLLIKSSDSFIEYAKAISTKLGISPFIIGITIVSIGTSLPELITSIIAVINKSSEIVIGNVVGSNIANIFLIGGASALIGKNLHSKHNLIGIDLPFFLGSALFLWLTLLDKRFSLFEGILFTTTIFGYLIFSIKNKKKVKKKSKEKIKAIEILGIIIASIIIYLSAKYTIKSVLEISQILNISTGILASTVIALGTSLPELSVSLSAIKKKQTDMIFVNIIGSNIFNILGVMGLSRFFGAILIPNNLFNLLIPFFLSATVIFFIMTQEDNLSRTEGMLLVIMYIFFLGSVINI